MRVEATLAGGVRTRLILDTGGGVTLLSPGLCRKVGCTPDGSTSGKRMSGQELHIPLSRVPSITVAGHRVDNARVAVLDTDSLLHPELGVEGFAALDLFRDQPFTLDYPARRVILENAASLRERRAAGRSVKIRVEQDGPSTVVFLPMELAKHTPPLEMEIDSGSQSLILDQRFMAALGIDPSAAGVKRVEGKDETGHGYTRFFSALPRALAVKGAESVTAPRGSKVMFQRIIHDGLIGQNFLRETIVTFDLAKSQLIFAKR